MDIKKSEDLTTEENKAIPVCPTGPVNAVHLLNRFIVKRCLGSHRQEYPVHLFRHAGMDTIPHALTRYFEPL